MRVVLDTNIFERDFQMTGLEFRVFRASASAGHLFLCLARSTKDEVVNRYKLRCEAAAKKLNDATDKYRQLTGVSIGLTMDHDTLDREVTRYARDFLHRIGHRSLQLLPYPSQLHDHVLNRALVRLKPFTEGGRGYTDTLLWLSIVNLASSHGDPIALVTENTRDFARDKNLHPDLATDLAANGLGPEVVTLFSSLREFNEAEVLSKPEAADQGLVSQLKQGQPLAKALSEQLVGRSSSRLQAFSASEIGLPSPLGDVELSEFTEISNLKLIEARSLVGGLQLLTLDVEAATSLNFETAIGDYLALIESSDLDIDITPEPWGSPGMQAGLIMLQANAKLDILLDVSKNEIQAIELLTMRPVGG